MKRFPFYKQYDGRDCGPTCLKIISSFYGKQISLEYLKELCETTREGSNLLNIVKAAEQIGFRTLAVKINFDTLGQIPLPALIHWNQDHYVVLYKRTKNKMYVSDPAYGLINYSNEDFKKSWLTKDDNIEADKKEGIVVALEPSPKFYSLENIGSEEKFNTSFIFSYITKYKKFIFQLIFGLIASSMLQLVFPFLTQSIVDVGIKNQNIHFIFLILSAQIFIFLGKIGVEVIRSWILLHLSTRINISLISDFFIKLMNLPISYFDAKMTGDLLQRINDHKRIERVLTASSLSVLFSLTNLLIFGFILLLYDFYIFLIFVVGSLLYVSWILLFFKKRAELDYKKFTQLGIEQSNMIELINGMQEIKLHNAERQKRWGWERLQAKLFQISIKNLSLEQYQNVGSEFINELKNIIITIVSATLVINGDITLGMMLAIAYIVGQLNLPLLQMVEFLREGQDAKIALERLAEIHNKEDEELTGDNKITEVNLGNGISVKNMSFRYKGAKDFVLNNINFNMPSNKITAIVGSSGSGKTTLLKMLLKFYIPQEGTISLGKQNLNDISQNTWRNLCGVVMQEGYIFNDNIEKNIALGEEVPDKARIKQAAKIANIDEFIEMLPNQYKTKIGMEGLGLSTGQKQRILIARAVYKNPKILFFDEATSSLDANNEKIIMKNLAGFFIDKTVFIIAHRLSTVKNADVIFVLERGNIVERGSHSELVDLKGEYYRLVKNQLELGE
ncbi:peptidase domain-containing ABC transporter [Flavobacteriaceae bacterium M23B6Z8]